MPMPSPLPSLRPVRARSTEPASLRGRALQVVWRVISVIVSSIQPICQGSSRMSVRGGCGLRSVTTSTEVLHRVWVVR